MGYIGVILGLCIYIYIEVIYGLYNTGLEGWGYMNMYVYGLSAYGFGQIAGLGGFGGAGFRV